MREQHDLGRRIGHWTVSADVGARKPDERIYRAFLASTGLAPGEILFADDRAKNVDAAAALGFRTVLVDLAGVGDARPVARTIDELRTAVMEWISGR